MIKTARTITNNFSLALLLACLATLFLGFTGASSAFAATRPHPNALTVECLLTAAGISTANVGPDQVESDGYTTSVCGTQGTITNVTQKMVTTNGCEGSQGSSSNTELNFYFLDFHHTSHAQYIYDEWCAICIYQSSVLVGEEFPDFIVTLSVTSTGNYKSGGSTILATSGSPATASIKVTNTGLYAPPCPPTGSSTKTFSQVKVVKQGFVKVRER